MPIPSYHSEHEPLFDSEAISSSSSAIELEDLSQTNNPITKTVIKVSRAVHGISHGEMSQGNIFLVCASSFCAILLLSVIAVLIWAQDTVVHQSSKQCSEPLQDFMGLFWGVSFFHIVLFCTVSCNIDQLQPQENFVYTTIITPLWGMVLFLGSSWMSRENVCNVSSKVHGEFSFWFLLFIVIACILFLYNLKQSYTFFPAWSKNVSWTRQDMIYSLSTASCWAIWFAPSLLAIIYGLKASDSPKRTCNLVPFTIYSGFAGLVLWPAGLLITNFLSREFKRADDLNNRRSLLIQWFILCILIPYGFVIWALLSDSSNCPQPILYTSILVCISFGIFPLYCYLFYLGTKSKWPDGIGCDPTCGANSGLLVIGWYVLFIVIVIMNWNP